VPQESAPKAAEPFAAVLGSSVLTVERRFDQLEPSQETPSIGRAHSLPAKDGAALFPVEQRTYDTFLRALKESGKPLGAHALDLFQ
jgi:hypothetical protein